MKYGVALVHSTSLAIRAERACQAVGLTVKLIPTPRQLSSDCGSALRFLWDDRERVVQALADAQVETDAIHPLDG
ncbi:MAG: DUF3343 domain-containing protein [Chloroflexi bacterium]|nr:DUF3343 domain-containing protein [Chloroflexota bacterium]